MYLTTWIIPLTTAKILWTLTHNTPATLTLTLTTTILTLHRYNQYQKRRNQKK